MEKVLEIITTNANEMTIKYAINNGLIDAGEKYQGACFDFADMLIELLFDKTDDKKETKYAVYNFEGSSNVHDVAKINDKTYEMMDGRLYIDPYNNDDGVQRRVRRLIREDVQSMRKTFYKLRDIELIIKDLEKYIINIIDT